MKGRIVVGYSVWCSREDCVEWDDVDATSWVDANKVAREKGWKWVKSDGYVCPRCQEKEKKSKEAQS